VSGSGISRATCKSAPHSRQITTLAPHHSVFYALPATQPTASKHWRPKQNINKTKTELNTKTRLRKSCADLAAKSADLLVTSLDSRLEARLLFHQLFMHTPQFLVQQTLLPASASSSSSSSYSLLIVLLPFNKNFTRWICVCQSFSFYAKSGYLEIS